MKKIAACIAITLGVMSTQAFATEIKSGTPIQAGNQGCELLADAVSINLSSNVFGAYNCAKDNNTIRVATCHKAGSRKSGTIACAVVNVIPGKDSAEDTVVWNDPSCKDTESTFTSKSNGKGFVASTAGGSVAATSLDAFCDSATVVDSLIK